MSLGQYGEQLAKEFLQGKGWQIIAQNWRYGKNGEIDLVAYRPAEKLLIFVEVKTRRTLAYGEPAEAVTTKKQAQLIHLAHAYLSQASQYIDSNIRFDVMSIQMEPHPQITHLENAFSVDA